MNECNSGVDECQDICSNTYGSFICSCFSGYRLNDTDNKACDGRIYALHGCCYKYIYFLSQILMNVLRILQSVVTTVLIQLAITIVHVLLVTNLLMMILVMVCFI